MSDEMGPISGPATGPDTGRKANRTRLLRLAGTLIAMVLLVYLLSQQGWDEISTAIRQIPLWRLALALGLMLISRLAVTARWYVLLRAAEQPVTFLQTLWLTLAGLFASNFLPTTIGGDLVRLAGAIQMHLDPVLSASSLIVDRLVGMAGMALMAPFSLPALPAGAGVGAGPVSLSLAALPGNLVQAAGRWLRKLSRRLADALGIWLHKPGALILALACTGVHMACLFSLISVLLEGMGEGMPIWLIGGLYSLVYFVTLLPISVNGYGVQEISMTLIFSNLGRAPQGVGLTIALLFRTIMMAASLPGVLSLPEILATAKANEAQSPTSNVASRETDTSSR